MTVQTHDPIYEAHMEVLNRRFPGIELLTRGDIVELTGLSRKGVNSNFPFEGRYITKTNLALRLCRLGAPSPEKGEEERP